MRPSEETIMKFVEPLTNTLARKDVGFLDDEDGGIILTTRSQIHRPVKWHVWLNADGHYHRLNGPAVKRITDYCVESWYQNHKLHREDGPAIIPETPDLNAEQFVRWYLNDIEYSMDEYLEKVDLDEEEDTYLRLQYSHCVKTQDYIDNYKSAIDQDKEEKR